VARWAGEKLSDGAEFFVPLYIHPLAEWCPADIPYLPLQPGERFLIAHGHEGVGFDAMILRTGSS
jgi:hypothetical protein